MSDVTLLLDAAAAGDRLAASNLLPLVYEELRTLAAAKMNAENTGHALDATALVHEAYLRLTGKQTSESRNRFMRAAAEVMRRILVDYARGRMPDKRGGSRQRVSLDDAVHWIESLDHLSTIEDVYRSDGFFICTRMVN